MDQLIKTRKLMWMMISKTFNAMMAELEEYLDETALLPHYENKTKCI
jgi:hypothetical protein